MGHVPRTVHLVGIGGVFMGGLARLAQEFGYVVSGCDRPLYPPMSDQLADLGVVPQLGFEAAQLDTLPQGAEVVIGNVATRGMPLVERLLEEDRPLCSGPEWLRQRVLIGRPVLAVAGTHGKTTTTSMLAWILNQAGMQPGFLVGGVPENFGVSARLGAPAAPFVLEADEYDSAFFDKRAKFVHYRPRVLVLNNLEFDHADIYRDLADIERQFAHLLRTLPASAMVLANLDDPVVAALVARERHSRLIGFGRHQGEWRLLAQTDAPGWSLAAPGVAPLPLQWGLLGEHNARNALAAVAAAAAVGVPVPLAVAALADFRGVARRLTLRFAGGGVRYFDDFAHHPTAIAATLAALRPHGRRLVAVLELRSNSMRAGAHSAALPAALAAADEIWLRTADGGMPVGLDRARGFTEVADVVPAMVAAARPGDVWVSMSNGGFDGLPAALAAALVVQFPQESTQGPGPGP